MNKKQLDFVLRFWRLTRWAKRIGHLTPFRRATGLIASERAFKGSFVPVREDVEIPPGVVAPREILKEYIERACSRTIAYDCPCRLGEGCGKYPEGLGCMLLGEGARDVDPSMGYQATKEQALAHLDRALEAGLLPLVGHIKIDQVVYGVKDYNKFLTMCFCCPCCCVVRSNMNRLVGAFPGSLRPLAGVSVSVTDDCVGCGECVNVCPVGNIELIDDVAVIGEKCLACGTCVDNCSRGFIRMSIERGSRMDEELRRRVEAGVRID